MIEETLLEAIEKMEKAVGHVQSQFQTVRTGRAPRLRSSSASASRSTTVTPSPCSNSPAPRCPKPQLLVRARTDRSTLAAIEKAIHDSDLGVNPSNDGTVIRLSFPPLTEERRKEYVKVVKHMAEEGRVRRAQPAP